MIHEYVAYVYLSEPMVLLVLLSLVISGAHLSHGECPCMQSLYWK